MSSLSRLFWGALVAKLALATILPLTSDEAYYWVWSQHPQLSYFDHPPFVAWLFAVGQKIRFIPGGVRWPGLLLAHAGLWIWLQTLARYFNDEQRWWWLILALVSPLLGGSALIITPDVPLLFFYALSTWLFLWWREGPNYRRALALGMALGTGFSSKYMMVLWPLSALWPVCREGAGRAALRQSMIWLVLGATIGMSPVWAWNLMNEFASLKFQAHHGLGHHHWKPSWTIEYIGLQLALITPPIALWAWRSRRALPDIFAWLAFTPLVFFLFTTARGYVEANWPIEAYPAILALAVAGWPRSRAWLRGLAAVWFGLLVGLAASIVISPGWAQKTKLREFRQFDGVALEASEGRPLFARSYQMAAKLSYELDRPIYKLKGMLRHDFFDELAGSMPDQYPYYVIIEPGDRLPPALTERGDHVIERRSLDGFFDLIKVGGR